MKKALKTIIISILAICMIFPIVACDSSSASSKTPGLKYKKMNGVYTVYDYVQEEGVTELDFSKAIPADVTDIRINKGVFAGNTKLTKIIVSDAVTEIKAGAFEKMGALVTLELPFVGRTALADTFVIESKKDENKSINAERTIAHLFGTEEYDAGVALTIKHNANESTTCYVPYAFRKVVINATADYKVPMFAFSGAVNLDSIELKGKITDIGNNAFEGVKEITSITIPASVKTIGENAFTNCAKLKTVTIASSSALTTVKKGAFVGTAVNDTALDGAINLTPEQKTDIFGE